MARRPNAYSQLIQEGQNLAKPEPGKRQERTVTMPIPEDSNTVIRQNRNTAKSGKTVKITIYPSEEQLAKLYDFMEAYRKRTGVRINQQDMIRRIIDTADINTVLL